ncbi:hypothetical protein SAMN04488033_1051, partial [Salegentibacter agarivorans]
MGQIDQEQQGAYQKQLRELWFYVEQVYDQEQMLPNEPDFEAIDPAEVAKTIDAINDAL